MDGTIRCSTNWISESETVRYLLILLLMMVSGAARADIILLLSDEKTPVMGVADAIRASYGEKIETYNLKGSHAQESQIAQAALNSNTQQVVAVGLLAAQLARQRLQSKQVIFCQVLNVDEFDLTTPSMKGVSGLPSLNRQFMVWKTLDPDLRRIGVIVGSQTHSMLEEAEDAARRNGLEIVRVEASSDRAVLFAAQDLLDKKIQRLWLAPDSSILSQRAILDLMAWSVKNNVQVLAFSPVLLKEGALLGASADYADIAHLVLERLKKAANSPVIPGDQITSLSTARIVISSGAAARFGLVIPAKLKEQADVR